MTTKRTVELPVMATAKHWKRGSTYDVLGVVQMQVSHPRGHRVIYDGEPLTIYRAEDGTLYARWPDEFHDGRFEITPTNTDGE